MRRSASGSAPATDSDDTSPIFVDGVAFLYGGAFCRKSLAGPMSTQRHFSLFSGLLTAKPTTGTRMAAVRIPPPAMATVERNLVRVMYPGSSE